MLSDICILIILYKYFFIKKILISLFNILAIFNSKSYESLLNRELVF